MRKKNTDKNRLVENIRRASMINWYARRFQHDLTPRPQSWHVSQISKTHEKKNQIY